MSTIEAVKKYFSTPERPVTNQELMELKRALKSEEWDQFGKDTCAALGETWGKGI